MYRYDLIVDLIRKQVAAGSLKVGDRLPSVRQMSRLTGFSTVTVHHGYALLESQGVCTARPKSGFYLTRLPSQFSEFPEETLEAETQPRKIAELNEALLLSWRRKGLEAFGAFYPCGDLFERREIDKIMRQIMRKGKSRLPDADLPEGDPLLRQQISRRIASRGTIARAKDIVVTGSAMESFSLCLDAFTQPGDVVLVESPSYFPMLADVRRRNLQVVELYSHPVHGIDPEQFEYLVQHNSIRVAVLMVTNHYPTGVTYPESTMLRVVEASRKHNVTILENDMLGELTFGNSPSTSLKQFDPDDTVIQFSSFENSLSHEYGLGWVVAGRHATKILAARYLGGHAARDGLVQRAVAEFLASRSQDRHLRQLRAVLATRVQRGIEIMGDKFPPYCSVSKPNGGFMCWVRVPQRHDSQSLAVDAAKLDFTILPGPVFSVAGSFQNFFALNLSFPWTQDGEEKVSSLGALLK